MSVERNSRRTKLMSVGRRSSTCLSQIAMVHLPHAFTMSLLIVQIQVMLFLCGNNAKALEMEGKTRFARDVRALQEAVYFENIVNTSRPQQCRACVEISSVLDELVHIAPVREWPRELLASLWLVQKLEAMKFHCVTRIWHKRGSRQGGYV